MTATEPFARPELERLGPGNEEPTGLQVVAHGATAMKLASVNIRNLCSGLLGDKTRGMAQLITERSRGRTSPFYWKGMAEDEAKEYLSRCVWLEIERLDQLMKEYRSK